MFAGIVTAMLAQAALERAHREQYDKWFASLSREEQDFELRVRQTKALESLARQGPPRITIENHSSLFR